jgi:hypothetical protein
MAKNFNVKVIIAHLINGIRPGYFIQLHLGDYRLKPKY